MFPQLSEALLHERVRDYHRAAEASRLARLARKGQPVAAAPAARPVTALRRPALRSLTTARRGHAPARHAGQPRSRRAA
jgi:hypothetical protein